MTQLQTQLFSKVIQNGIAFADSQAFLDSRQKPVQIYIEQSTAGVVYFTDYDQNSDAIGLPEEVSANVDGVYTRNNGETYNPATAIYTFLDGQPNRFLTATITPEPTATDIDLDSGYGEKDLTTNLITYFAKKFKLKASDFVMDSDGIVEINPEKLASLTVDLTNIVNISIKTQNLTSVNSDIGTAVAESLNTSELTAATSSLGQSSASKLEVGSGGLIWEDAQGHKHQFVNA